jgi:hypothetical protein
MHVDIKLKTLGPNFLIFPISEASMYVLVLAPPQEMMFTLVPTLFEATSPKADNSGFTRLALLYLQSHASYFSIILGKYLVLCLTSDNAHTLANAYAGNSTTCA